MANNVIPFNPSALPAFARARTELSPMAKALAGGGDGGNRISIKGGTFRLIAGGKEIAAVEERYLDVVVVNAAPKIARVFYMSKYDSENPAAPDCWSPDGERPDKDASDPQAATCASCPQNIAGSGQGTSRACRYQQRLAVVLANNMEGDVLQLAVPATSLFGKEDGENRPLQAYARWLAAQNIDPSEVITRLRFDQKSESPKLFFKAMRWLTDDEYPTIKEQGQTPEAIKAITMTVAKTDNATPAAPANLAGQRPTKPTATPTPAPAPAPEEEPEAPAPAPKATRTRKPAATPAPAPQEEPEEPVVRKEATKPQATPAKNSSLAAAVADWDDE